MVSHWTTVPREGMKSLSLDTLKTQLEEALQNLIQAGLNWSGTDDQVTSRSPFKFQLVYQADFLSCKKQAKTYRRAKHNLSCSEAGNH